MKRFFSILILSIIILYKPAVTVAASLSISVDKDQVSLEDVINLTISVEGARGEPALPSMPAFEATRQGSSSRVQIINGQISSSVDYSYLLYPKKEGSFTVGPATLDYNSSKITSNTVAITIGKAAARPAEAADKEVFVTAEVDNKNPYVNQQIVYTLKFYRRTRVANARLTETPSFEGFITEQLEKEKEYQTAINGKQFVVTEIKQALFPAQAGALTITPSTLQCDVVVKRQRRGGGFNDPFFDDSFLGFSQTEQKILRTTPIEVTVKPLPEEGKPPDYTNLVGEFRAAAEISKKKLEVGESATLTLTLTGSGNLKSSQSLKLENLEGFKVYDDKPSFEQQITGGKVSGTLIIKKALVPLKEGSLQIPAIAISYFNPRSGTYETARTEPQTLEVLLAKEKEKLQMAEAEKSGTAKQEIKIIGKDILPIHTAVDALSPVTLNPFSWVTALLFFIPVLGFGAGFALKHQKEKNAVDTGLIRSKFAYKNFSRKISAVKKSIALDDVSFYRDAGKAVKDFIGDKLNVSGGALTPAEIEHKLTEARVVHETIDKLKNLIEMLEAAQFAFKNYSCEEREALLSSLQKTAKEIDKKIR
jgi:hypothetical protein